MFTRELGRSGLRVSTMGLGCMGMSEFYGQSDEAQSVATLHHAIDAGITFWDTADMYGSGHNEELIGRAIRGRRDEVVLATKCFAPMGPALVTLDDIGDPHRLRLTASVDGVTMQDGHTGQMIFDIPAVLAYVSEDMTLMPGDVISTGTPAILPPRFSMARLMPCAMPASTSQRRP